MSVRDRVRQLLEGAPKSPDLAAVHLGETDLDIWLRQVPASAAMKVQAWAVNQLPATDKQREVIAAKGGDKTALISVLGGDAIADFDTFLMLGAISFAVVDEDGTRLFDSMNEGARFIDALPAADATTLLSELMAFGRVAGEVMADPKAISKTTNGKRPSTKSVSKSGSSPLSGGTSPNTKSG